MAFKAVFEVNLLPGHIPFFTFFRKNCLNTAIFSYIPSWNNLTDEILWNKKKVKYESL